MLDIINQDKGNENVVQDSKFFKFLKGIFSNDDKLEKKLKYACNTYLNIL